MRRKKIPTIGVPNEVQSLEMTLEQESKNVTARDERIAAAGALIERNESGVRISMPPLRGILVLAPWQWIVLAIIAFRQYLHWGDFHGFIVWPDGIAFVAISIYVLCTFWRRRVMIVNDDEVAIGFSNGRGLFWAKRWPKRAIGEIKVNPENGNLMIRVTGVDLKNFRISGDRVVTQAVADILQEELSKKQT